MRRRQHLLWCWVSGRHRGFIRHDSVGVFWQCRRCDHRMYVRWEDTYYRPEEVR